MCTLIMPISANARATSTPMMRPRSRAGADGSAGAVRISGEDPVTRRDLVTRRFR